MVITIEGKFVEHRWKFKTEKELESIPFEQAMKKYMKSFLSKFDDEEIAISVWTTPKRTKTYPFPRVYNTLSYGGTKITIIPVLVDYGKGNERGKIQPSTIEWMTSIGVYVILGVYIDAEKGEVGKLARNANTETKSRVGEPKFSRGQRFDLECLQEQIKKIIKEKPVIKEWNNSQLEAIPNLLEIGIKNYKRLGEEKDVPLSSFARLEKDVEKWKECFPQYLVDSEEGSKTAQGGETQTDHKLENVSGEKGKVNISFVKTRCRLTVDQITLNKDECLVTLLEAKNASEEKFPREDDIKDALFKLMIFNDSDFRLEDKKLKKKLVCSLNGTWVEEDRGNVESEFREEFQSIIDECNANNVELKLNDKIIKLES